MDICSDQRPKLGRRFSMGFAFFISYSTQHSLVDTKQGVYPKTVLGKSSDGSGSIHGRFNHVPFWSICSPHGSRNLTTPCGMVLGRVRCMIELMTVNDEKIHKVSICS
jgi:hypothetical protein